jgi:hypothetical protein
MGIEPGVTTVSEAAAILEANPWVDKVVFQSPDFHWTWSDRHPAFIRGDINGRLGVISGNSIVYEVDIQTTISLGDFWASLGVPNWQNFTSSNDRLNPSYMDYQAWYSNKHLFLWTEVDCRTSLVRQDFWKAPVMLTWTNAEINTNFPDYNLFNGLNHQYGYVCYPERRHK